MAGQGSDEGMDTPPMEEVHGVAAVDGYYGYHSPTEHSTEGQVPGIPDDSGVSFREWDVDTLRALGWRAEASMPDEGDTTTGVLIGSTTGGVTPAEMRRADLTFVA